MRERERDIVRSVSHVRCSPRADDISPLLTNDSKHTGTRIQDMHNAELANQNRDAESSRHILYRSVVVMPCFLERCDMSNKKKKEEGGNKSR